MVQQVTLELDPTYELWERDRCACRSCCAALVDLVRRYARDESERRGVRLRIDVQSLARGGERSHLLRHLVDTILRDRRVVTDACDRSARSAAK
jgi:hypothetical protein